MEEDLRARLLLVPAVVAAGAKVAWFERPRNSPTAIELTVVYLERGWTHDGPDGFDHARIQCDCWSRDSVIARTIEAGVEAELERHPMTITGGTRFFPGFVTGRQRLVEDEAGNPLYRVMLDIEFDFQPVN